METLLQVRGNKKRTLLLSENALLFSSSTFNTNEEFYKMWNNNLTLTTKKEIKYINKEGSEDIVSIHHRSISFIKENSEISFKNKGDFDVFLKFLEEKQYFKKVEETLSPFKASISYILGLLFIIGFTILTHYEAINYATGKSNYEGKSAIYLYLANRIGDVGIWSIGIIVSIYLIYKIWKRIIKPPILIKILPPGKW